MTLPNPAFFAQFDHAKLDAADKAHYMHGFHMFDEHREQGSLNIAAGNGAYIYDTHGNRYLDAVEARLLLA
jgi:adenosylmethionine-8-amino-7-oxononanoate aminotransferase